MNPQLNFIILSVIVSTCYAAESFYVKNKKIYDANDKEFLIRGVNNAHADWDNWNRFYALKALPAIAATKSNTVRVQWRMKHSNNDLNINHLKQVLQRCRELKLVAMVQLHDATGSPDPNIVADSAKWFVNNMWLFREFQRFVIINIANEWSPHGTSRDAWVNAYRWPIQHIRNSGWKGIIVVDAPAYAQDPISVATGGKQLVNADPMKNVAFSIHAYAEWKKSGGRYIPWRHFQQIQDAGLTLIVGEFADKHTEHIQGRKDCPWADIDFHEIMKQCSDKQIGYLGWSWAGNGMDCGAPLTPLNLVQGDQQQESTWTNRNPPLTEWGWRLFKTPRFGIEATSRIASVF